MRFSTSVRVDFKIYVFDDVVFVDMFVKFNDDFFCFVIINEFEFVDVVYLL